MVITEYLDDHNLRRAYRRSRGHHREHGQKEEAGQVHGMRLRKLQSLPHVRLLP